jgi:quercetin dioxygenase-like cupin family protein
MQRPSHIPGMADVAVHHLGVADFRIIADTDTTDGAFALGEFSGREGAWTVPHIHANSLEAFYVLEGRFTFTLGSDDLTAEPGAFVLIPKGTRHVMSAGAGGGRFLTFWTPGGLEQMFVELGRLSADALRDPEMRRAISARYDSIPT